jgi:diguanylate cyclase (GGDEF)-like protein/PAS domain S-box-containing protein
MGQFDHSSTFQIGSVGRTNRAGERQRLFEQAAALLPVGAWSCDLATEKLTWTTDVFDLFGLAADEAPDRRSTVAMYSEESRDMLSRKRSRAIDAGAGFTLDAHVTGWDGAERWIRITAGTRRENGRIVELYGMKQDVTADHAMWARLREQAECDPLTGVANRARFQRFLGQTRAAQDLQDTGALLLFDMDGFKQLNDWWGHSAGDACLAAFGERLRIAFPGARFISRIGGDEFAVLLPPLGSRAATIAMVRCRLPQLMMPVAWNGQSLALGVSVGIAFASSEAKLGPQELYVAADRALYDAKAVGTSTLVCAQ